MSEAGPVPVEPSDPRVRAVLETDAVGTLVIRGDIGNTSAGDVSVFLDRERDPRGLISSSWWIRIHARDDAALDRLRPAIPSGHPFAEDGEVMFGGLAEWIHERLIPGYRVTWENRCWLYSLPEDASLPDEHPYEVRPLRAGDADLVNEHWPHGDDLGYVGWRIEAGPTAAVFEDDAPVSWAMTHGDEEMGFMTTLPGHRRRGLARSVTVGLVREIRARGKVPFLYSLQDNAPAQRLTESVGFVRHGAYHWFGGRPR